MLGNNKKSTMLAGGRMSTLESPQVITAAAQRNPSRMPGFPRQHPWDRNFFLLYVVLIWVGILSGFGPQIVKHVNTSAAPYPAVVHIHALAFVGWLALLTTQVLLIRSGRPDLHRRLGIAAVGLAAFMIVIGPITAVVVDRLRLTTPNPDAGFLVVQLTDIVGFAGLIVPALYWRNDSSMHKRLILLATLCISDAGFARWLASSLQPLLGDGYWGNVAQLYLGSDLLVVGVGLYDWMTRKRLHPAYLIGAAWIVALHLTAIAVYLNPHWAPLATRLLEH
jgi:hypothetical protein